MSDTAPESYITKVMGLLAKAESTDNAAEAEAFMAGAQRLMTKHSIDEAMIGAARGIQNDEIGADDVVCAAPYANGKAMLLNEVALNNDVHMIVLHSVNRGDKRCQLIGHASDVANVKLMFGALLMHGTREMLKAAVPWGENTRSFRAGFLLAYGARIGERMAEARSAAIAEHEAETGASVAVVLADRSKAVDRRFRELYPRTKTSRARTSSAAGMGAGHAAANRADIGGSARIAGHGRQALGA